MALNPHLVDDAEVNDPALPPAGWHPDPWDTTSRSVRYWDGQQWTGYVAFASGPPIAELLASEQQGARFARWGIVAMAAVALLTSLLIPSTIHWFMDEIDRMTASGFGSEPVAFGPPAGQFAFQFVGFLSLAPLAALVVWQYRANMTSIALRIPLTRTPGYGVAGWFIPIANLWFPYEAIRDNVPAGHPVRRTIFRWWIGYFALGLFSWVAALGWLLVPALGAALWLAFALYVAWWAMTGRRIIDTVTQVHAALAANPR